MSTLHGRDTFIGRTLAAHHRQRSWCRDPEPVVRHVFTDLMEQARGTVFGRDHGLGGVRTPADFKTAVPVAGYEAFRGYVDRIRAGEPRVLTASAPYALHTTSGTTGHPKYIPTTRHWRNHYRGPVLYAQWGLYFQRLGLNRYQRGNVLDMSWERGVRRGATLPGDELPVYSITKRPAAVGPEDWLPPWYGEPWFVNGADPVHTPGTPGTPDTGADSLYTKLRLLAGSDVRLIVTVNPSRITALGELLNDHLDLLLKDLRDGTLRGARVPDAGADPGTAARLAAARAFGGRVTLVDLWPRLALLVCWNSASARYYRSWLEQHAPGVPVVPFSSTGTEGIVTLPVDTHSSAAPLAVNQGLYEFVPCEPWDAGAPLAADTSTVDSGDLSVGSTYRLIMSQTNGMYRYDTGDIYRVVGWVGRVPRLDFEGRSGSVSSFTGEKLTESDVHAAIRSAAGRSSVGNGYSVLPVWGRPPGYVLAWEWPGETHPEGDRFCARVDEELCRVNIEYAEKRRSGRLAPLRAFPVSPGAFRALAERRVAWGASAAQVKHRWLHTDDTLLHDLAPDRGSAGTAGFPAGPDRKTPTATEHCGEAR